MSGTGAKKNNGTPPAQTQPLATNTPTPPSTQGSSGGGSTKSGTGSGAKTNTNTETQKRAPTGASGSSGKKGNLMRGKGRGSGGSPDKAGNAKGKGKGDKSKGKGGGGGSSQGAAAKKENGSTAGGESTKGVKEESVGVIPNLDEYTLVDDTGTDSDFEEFFGGGEGDEHAVGGEVKEEMLTRSEEKVNKYLTEKLKLQKVEGILRVTLVKKPDVLFVFPSPTVYFGPEGYIIVGNFHVQDLNVLRATSRPEYDHKLKLVDYKPDFEDDRQHRLYFADPPESEMGDVDLTGIDSNLVDELVKRVGLTRTRAARNVAAMGEDAVRAILETPDEPTEEHWRPAPENATDLSGWATIVG
eukprot:comp13289_c0_seq1/m.8711 comp13289_c0_seq1/g.8711  ORF comp13289_c0_seq1/g.8711 comp13289_c0_seq1/m.8711 type:complete len:356 (-) comp13289_c0_seq1:153-1220(-)